MKTTLNFLKLIFVISLFGVIFSCEYSVEEELVEIENPDDEPLVATFSKDVKPIIDGRCIQCHNGNLFPDLRTYSGVSTNAALVKSEVAGRSMPQGSSLTQAQIDAVVNWVDNGAKND